MILAQAKRKNRIRQRWDDNLFDVISTIFLALSVLVVAYPLLYVVSASFSSTNAVMAGKVWLFPVDPTLVAYQAVFTYQSIMTGYLNSAIYTVCGTAINLLLTILCAFCLSSKDFYGRKVVSVMVIFTMLFNAGLIPNYLLIKNLGWLNTIWSLIIPNAMSAWYVILMRSYFSSSISRELFEASSLDGCSVYRQLWSIVLPLSGPIIAVISLYCAVGIWNSYFDAFIYISKKELFPLQVVLRNILILNQVDMTTVADLRDMASRQGMSNLLKYAVIVVSSVPLLVLYPFVQKYFVKGIMIGAVKG
ncbi:MAG TPA: carbohydrate ABC transporter permease [Candidatus Limiplasma sp.]|nr:carbohydrate ABC transporter permease [Candidatus Limiplasma sp.]